MGNTYLNKDNDKIKTNLIKNRFEKLCILLKMKVLWKIQKKIIPRVNAHNTLDVHSIKTQISAQFEL